MDDLTKRYRDFFLESHEGQQYMQRLHKLIDAEHESAEKNPELARDHTQRAKGVRLAIETINSLTAGAKKGKNTDK